jgi:hypothetical protein
MTIGQKLLSNCWFYHYLLNRLASLHVPHCDNQLLCAGPSERPSALLPISISGRDPAVGNPVWFWDGMGLLRRPVGL